MNETIGHAAGRVWVYLEQNGEVTTAKLLREADGTRDLLQRAIGWLAREDKIAFRKDRVGEKVALKK